MSLRSRIVAILFGVVVLYAACDHLLQRTFVHDSFVELERSRAEADVERVVKALHSEIRHLDARCDAWASWDETFRFVASPEEEYVRSNLATETFAAAGLNLLYVCDSSGRVVWGRILEFPGARPITLREFPSGGLSSYHPLLPREGAPSGILMTERGPMLVSSRPITDTRRQEAPRGRVILGSLLTRERIEALSGQTGTELALWPIDDPGLPDEESSALDEITGASSVAVVREVDAERLHAYTLFPDLRAAPTLLVRATIPRDISARGAIAVRYALVSTIAAGLLLVLVLLHLLQKAVIGPIGALTRHAVEIGRNDETSRRIGMIREDEIGVLSREFDSMMEKLSQSRAALVVTARAAGMSEIANSVLHNVGNVLNSVNVSARMVEEKTRRSSLSDLQLALKAVEESSGDLATFLARDPRGAHLEPLLRSVAEQMAGEQLAVLEEVRSLAGGLDHIKTLVQAQQSYAGRSGVLEVTSLPQLVEGALSISSLSPDGDPGIEILREYEEVAPCPVDRHRLTEILVNVLRNARESVAAAGRADPRIQVRLRQEGPESMRIEVEDNGVGIAAEDLERVFTHGFTTKKTGHGFGLHSAANAATEMRGRLGARSAGRGHGATFFLVLPVRARAAEPAMEAA